MEKPTKPAESLTTEAETVIISTLRTPSTEPPAEFVVIVVDIVPAGCACVDLVDRCIAYTQEFIIDLIGKRNFHPTIDSTQELTEYPAGVYVMRKVGTSRINLYYTHNYPGFFRQGTRVEHIGYVEFKQAVGTTLGLELAKTAAACEHLRCRLSRWGMSIDTDDTPATPMCSPIGVNCSSDHVSNHGRIGVPAGMQQSPNESPNGSPQGNTGRIRPPPPVVMFDALWKPPSVVSGAWAAVINELKLSRGRLRKTGILHDKKD